MCIKISITNVREASGKIRTAQIDEATAEVKVHKYNKMLILRQF